MATKQQQRSHKERAKPKNYLELVKVIDSTDFRFNPYRGILSKCAKTLGYKNRDGIWKAVRTHRNAKAMSLVVSEIRKVDKMMREALCD